MTVLTTSLTGAAERPNPGDPGGSGREELTLFPDKGCLCFAVAVRGIKLPAVGHHVHRGTADQAGPVVIPLGNPNAAGTAAGCVTADAALLRDIAQTPSGFNVNVHTTDFPAAAARGQLAAAG